MRLHACASLAQESVQQSSAMTAPESRAYWVHVMLIYPDDDFEKQNDVRENLKDELIRLQGLREQASREESKEGMATATMQGTRSSSTPAPVPLMVVVSSDCGKLFNEALLQTLNAVQLSSMGWKFTLNFAGEEFTEVSDEAWTLIQEMIAEGKIDLPAGDVRWWALPLARRVNVSVV